MTLLVTIDTAKRVIMVSDRRVTVPKRQGGFAHIDDEWNKAVVVTCPQVQFGAMFAGLAAFVRRVPADGLSAVPARKRTSAVIHSCFQRTFETNGFSDDIIWRFATAIGDEYRKIGFGRCDCPELTIFCHGYHMSQNMFAAVISNKECIKRRAPAKFDVELDRREPRQHGRSKRACRIRTYGTGSATFDALFISEMKELNRRGYFNRVREQYIVGRVVDYIRRTADKLGSASVGKSCMSITLFKEPLNGIDFAACYYPYGPIVKRPWYAPLIVHAHDMPPPQFTTLVMRPSGFELRP